MNVTIYVYPTIATGRVAASGTKWLTLSSEDPNGPAVLVCLDYLPTDKAEALLAAVRVPE